LPFSWGPGQQYDTGSSNAVAMDDFGHVVEVHVGSGRLFYHVGTANFADQTIDWGAEEPGQPPYDTGSSNAVALDNEGHVVEVHVGSGRLFYHVGTANFANHTIDWGEGQQYDTGDSNAVAIAGSGQIVEVHVGSGRLFYHVGVANFANQTIDWGEGQQYDTGSSNAVALWEAPGGTGNALEVHVGSGRLFYRVGAVDFAKQMITWGDSFEYDTGDSNAVAMDASGEFAEVHVGSGRLFYSYGTPNVLDPNQRSTRSPSIEYDTGGPNAVAYTLPLGMVEVHVGSGRLFYRVGRFT
jgi:hypothetical protein